MREDAPHGGTSLAEAGLNGMLDISALMEHHVQVSEGLAVSQMLTSHLPGAVMCFPTKYNEFGLGDADGEAICSTE